MILVAIAQRGTCFNYQEITRSFTAVILKKLFGRAVFEVSRKGFLQTAMEVAVVTMEDGYNNNQQQ